MYHCILYFITVFTCSFYGSYRPEIKCLCLFISITCDIDTLNSDAALRELLVLRLKCSFYMVNTVLF